MAAVLGRAVQVVGRVGARIGDRGGVDGRGALAEGLLDRGGPQRDRAHVHEANAGGAVATTATPTIAQSWARRTNFWNPHGARQPSGVRISTSTSSSASAVSQNPRKKSVAAISRSPDGPRATSVAAKGKHDGGKVGGGIAVRQRSADRAAGAHLRVADEPCGVREQGHVLAQHRRALDVAVAGERADGDVVTGVADVGQVGDAADVDEHRRASPDAASSAAAASGRRPAAWPRRRAR